MLSCTERTVYGECVGLFEKGDPDLVYKINLNNVIVGFFFSETVIVPAIILWDYIECPVGIKSSKHKKILKRYDEEIEKVFKKDTGDK